MKAIECYRKQLENILIFENVGKLESLGRFEGFGDFEHFEFWHCGGPRGLPCGPHWSLDAP
mgnify:CR=1 FL=1